MFRKDEYEKKQRRQKQGEEQPDRVSQCLSFSSCHLAWLTTMLAAGVEEGRSRRDF